MKRTMPWINSLYISVAAFLLSACGHVTVPDTVIWSYVGDINGVAAIGSHTNFTKHERMNIDEWVAFLSSPAICVTSSDYAKQKNAIDQACYKAKCSYEEKKKIDAVAARLSAHIRGIKKINGVTQ